MVAFAFVAINLLLSVRLLPSDITSLSVGQVAPHDIEAPRNVEVIDEAATRRAREEVIRQLQDSGPIYVPRNVYGEIDVAIVRTFRALSLMRSLDPQGRAQSIKSLPVALSSTSVAALLKRSPQKYDEYNQTIHQLLENALRDKVTEQQLDEARSRMAEAMQNSKFKPDIRAALTEMAQNALRPNWVPDYQATVKDQQEKLAHVEPVKVVITRGQMIIRKGDVVSYLQLQILDALGFHQPTFNLYAVLANALFVALLIFVVAIYIAQQEGTELAQPRLLWLLTLLVVAALGLSRAGIQVSPYLTPIAMASILMSILLDYRLSLLVTAFLGLCVGIMTMGSVPSDLTPCVAATITGVVAVLSVTNVSRRGDLMMATLVVVLVNVVAVLVVNLWGSDDILSSLGTNALYYGSLNGLAASVLAIGALPFLETVFNVTTHIKLLELSNHTSEPLLQRLMTDAPGTYHHSMIVANLAEAAARRVGGDPLLAKVGAFYHDIGKMKAAHFFVENQVGQENPHDRLSPRLSAHIIISHVTDGVEMARTARLPQVVADFIDMHHGNRLVSYFYHKALQHGEEVNQTDYRYQGRRPRSRETAIVMMADTIEAKARLLTRPDQENLEKMVRESIKFIMDDGQLNDSDLSLRDIEQIAQAFVKTLVSIYHSRIEYPQLPSPPPPATSTSATPSSLLSAGASGAPSSSLRPQKRSPAENEATSSGEDRSSPRSADNKPKESESAPHT